MEEFKNDLIELFKKHNILVLKDSITIDMSPLYVDRNVKKRDVKFKFSQVMMDKDKAKEHADKYGSTIELV